MSIWPQGTSVGVLFFVLLLFGHPVLGEQLDPQEPSLRHVEPLGLVVADLESYIPAQLDESGIPGVAVALIRDGQVVWTAGFGTANRVTGTPVTPETAFEVASISKVVTAYAALRLVDQGRLSLDEPLVDSLATPWLPSSGYAGEVTLRHVASHSSGLPENDLLPADKSIAFEPGSAFIYSGVGFQYMQQAVEQVTGSSLEEAAQVLVFEPLGMSSSSFVGRFDVKPRMASGHVAYAVPLFFFLIPFGGILLVLVLAGIVVRRLRAGTWRLSRKLIAGNVAVAVLMTLVLVYMTLGRILPNLALLVVLSAVVFAVALASATFVGQQVIARLTEPPHRRRLRILWMIVTGVALAMLAGRMSGPMPSVLLPPPSAIGSLRTTAPDLAVFLAEVAAPRLLSEETADQISTPQVAINEDFSWGLGIGTQHSSQGEALWQNGMTPGFRSVMVIYPEHQWGVVVLTNSDDGLQVAYDVAARALGGKGHWSNF
jgi:CubicO group peptidase (beta-lactamase class C family)